LDIAVPSWCPLSMKWLAGLVTRAGDGMASEGRRRRRRCPILLSIWQTPGRRDDN